MIFATVGTQLPFPRLIAMLDALAGRHGLAITAQTGLPGTWPHLDVRPRLAPKAFEAMARAAERIVAHAGMGTVLTAQKLGKPLILVPRRVDLGEHVSDHQEATARELAGRPGIHVAEDTETLASLLLAPTLPPPVAVAPADQLVARLRAFVDTV